MNLTTSEFAGNLAKEKDLPIEHVDKILTEMTNVMNEKLFSGDNQLTKIMNFAKKRHGLKELVADVTEITELPEEEVIIVVNYMCTKMKASLKSGGVKNMMKMLKSIKEQSRLSDDEEIIQTEY